MKGSPVGSGRLGAVSGAAVALAVVVLLVVGLLAAFGRPAGLPRAGPAAPTRVVATRDTPAAAAGTAAPAPPARPGPTASAAPSPPAPPALLVLNNSRRPGLARRAARLFEDAGWPVRGTGNFTGRIPVTTVYYPDGQATLARRVAARFPGVRRVAPRFAGLPGSGLTVVVTREFPA